MTSEMPAEPTMFSPQVFFKQADAALDRLDRADALGGQNRHDEEGGDRPGEPGAGLDQPADEAEPFADEAQSRPTVAETSA